MLIEKKFLRLEPPEGLQYKREKKKKRKKKRREGPERGESESMKKCAEFWEAASIYRGWDVRKFS